MLVIGHMIPEKAFPHWKKYEYYLEWNCTEETVKFRWLVIIEGNVIHAYLDSNFTVIQK